MPVGTVLSPRRTSPRVNTNSNFRWKQKTKQKKQQLFTHYCCKQTFVAGSCWTRGLVEGERPSLLVPPPALFLMAPAIAFPTRRPGEERRVPPNRVGNRWLWTGPDSLYVGGFAVSQPGKMRFAIGTFLLFIYCIILFKIIINLWFPC